VQLITTNAALRSHLLRLIKTYPNISFAVAWATPSDVFSKLVLANNKIRSAVIGTHFYQTHPDVLDTFIESETVRFQLQPSGVFHPKLYLFWGDNSFEAIIGSANLTKGALSVNTEASVLLTHQDHPTLKDELQALIASYGGNRVTADEATRYRRLWEARQPELRKLEDIYGASSTPLPAVTSAVMSMDWPAYLQAIQEQDAHGFKPRLTMLDQVQDAFHTYGSLSAIPLDLRKGVAGLRSKTLTNSEWFGSMSPNGEFKKRMGLEDPHFSTALDHIPATGTVTRDQYNSFLTEYLKAFPDGRSGIGTATRLLSMKRPDQFLCISSANAEKLREKIGYPYLKSGDYDRYWDEVVELVMATPWWKSPPPAGGDELKAWRARTAMLDALFYAPKSGHQTS
jgi:HKD family nuclease